MRDSIEGSENWKKLGHNPSELGPHGRWRTYLLDDCLPAEPSSLDLEEWKINFGKNFQLAWHLFHAINSRIDDLVTLLGANETDSDSSVRSSIVKQILGSLDFKNSATVLFETECKGSHRIRFTLERHSLKRTDQAEFKI